jgi:hypothetical protein
MAALPFAATTVQSCTGNTRPPHIFGYKFSRIAAYPLSIIKQNAAFAINLKLIKGNAYI